MFHRVKIRGPFFILYKSHLVTWFFSSKKQCWVGPREQELCDSCSNDSKPLANRPGIRVAFLSFWPKTVEKGPKKMKRREDIFRTMFFRRSNFCVVIYYNSILMSNTIKIIQNQRGTHKTNNIWCTIRNIHKPKRNFKGWKQLKQHFATSTSSRLRSSSSSSMSKLFSTGRVGACDNVLMFGVSQQLLWYINIENVYINLTALKSPFCISHVYN